MAQACALQRVSTAETFCVQAKHLDRKHVVFGEIIREDGDVIKKMDARWYGGIPAYTCSPEAEGPGTHSILGSSPRRRIIFHLRSYMRIFHPLS